MLAHHRKVLLALDEHTLPQGEMCVGFALIVRDTGMSRSEVRRIVRHLARRGYAQFYQALWTDSGEPAGAGYCITPEGRAVLHDEEDA